MKITLKAHIPEHCEIIKLFPNGYGVSLISNKFIVECAVEGLLYRDSVTIDLDIAEMDLRLAIGTDIEFDTRYNKRLRIEQVTKYSKTIGYGLWKNGEKCGEFEIEKIQLSKDYLERIGVTIEGGEG